MADRAIYSIVDYGAVADSRTLNTDHIQAAIDACTRAGGGQVYVPPGRFLTGTILLKDHVTLYLEAGATLLGSTRSEDYRPKNLIRAFGATSVGIAGRGTIDGQGPAFWLPKTGPRSEGAWRTKLGWVPTRDYDHPPDPRPDRLVRIEDCTNVAIEGVTMTNAESWTLLFLGCDDVSVRGIRILNPLHGPNTDGIDVSSSQNVIISDCYICTADDAICLKNEVPGYTDRPCRDICVTNCVLCTVCNGFKIGTGTVGCHEDIVFSNSIIKAGLPEEPLASMAAQVLPVKLYGNGLGPLAGIAIETVDGGATRRVAIQNIVMHGARAPIFIRRANRASLQDPAAVPGELRDVLISNVVADGASTTSSITGLPGFPVRGVTLSDIRIETQGGGTQADADRVPDEEATSYPESSRWGHLPACGLYLRHVKDVALRNVRINAIERDARPLLLCDDVEDLRLLGVRAGPGTPSAHVFRNARDLIIRED